LDEIFGFGVWPGGIAGPTRRDVTFPLGFHGRRCDESLLKPSDPKLQLYWVARHNETVELTPRGREYWWLLVNDKI